MSILFGWRQARDTIAQTPGLYEMARATSRWAPHGTFVATSAQVGMGIQPYRTRDEDPLQIYPTVDELGNVLTFDGRLDNRRELSELLDLGGTGTTEAEVILAAFLRWGEACFSELIGDWAIALWSKLDQTLYLARDHAGTRSLYYRLNGGCIRWSTYLETLIAGSYDFSLDLRYAARFIACLPTGELTPYRSIMAVPHNHYVKVRDRSVSCHCHWQRTSESVIRYASDLDYEEHFRVLFRQAVTRRLDGGALVLAELSGGLDSSSIVCMADAIRRAPDGPVRPPLDTVSYFNDTEKSWNERPYVEIVEAARSIRGHHVNLSNSVPTFESNGIPYPLPGASKATIGNEQLLATAIGAGRYRAVLSGIGGDELLGGNPHTDFALGIDALDGRYRTFLRNAVSWSLATRKPLAHTVKGALHLALAHASRSTRHPDPREVPWLRTKLQNAESPDIRGSHFPIRWSSFALRKATHESILSSIVETMPHTKHPFLYRREFRYPYLDRDLLSFLFNIPHEQLALPGRRRSLMRRALRGIVPEEILERRRKAFLLRSPLASLRGSRQEIERLFRTSSLIDHNMIDADLFFSSVDKVVRGVDLEAWAPVMRTIEMELWLQARALHGDIQASV